MRCSWYASSPAYSLYTSAGMPQAKISHSGVVLADSADQRPDVVNLGVLDPMRRDQSLQPMLQRPLGVLPDCQVAAVSRCHILEFVQVGFGVK